VSTTNDSLLQRVQASYQRLTSVASDLNDASDELGKAINALDESLKKLNLGIITWHRFAVDMDESGDYWAKYIGYSKKGAKWGIGLRRTSGNADTEHHAEEDWLFNDAPRQLRMEAVEHIPAMIDALTEAAEKAVEGIKTKTAEARQLADLLAPPAKPKSIPRTALRPPRPPFDGGDPC
jgi:hypothetical protein